MLPAWTRHIGSDVGEESVTGRAESIDDSDGFPKVSRVHDRDEDLHNCGDWTDDEDKASFAPKAKSARTIDQAMDDQVLQGWNALVRTCASNLSTGPRELLQPWERGFMASVFSSSSSSQPLGPSLLNRRPAPVPLFVPEPSTAVPSQVFGAVSTGDPRTRVVQIKGAWEAVATRLGGVSWAVSTDAIRSKSLLRLQDFMMLAPEHTGLGRRLMSDIMSLKSDSYVGEVVSDVFARKAPRTLAKRARALILYVTYCTHNNLQILPISENNVYAYLKSECLHSPAKAKHFRESLNFLSNTLQPDGLADVQSSARISGSCHKQQLTKRPLKQSNTLLVSQVLGLESLVVTPGENDQDKCMSGQALTCLHLRARWSDGMWLSSVVPDIHPEDPNSSLFEASTLVSKTSTTAEKKTTFLPMVGIIGGLSLLPWYDEWMLARERCGLCVEQGKPMLPVVKMNGKFGTAPMDSSAGSRWLRELLLRVDADRSKVVGISTHGLKATVLSWAAKWGMHRETRQILGYHIVQGASSMLHYSRDELAAPMRKLCSLYSDIREHQFNPDSTRSGYLRVKGLVPHTAATRICAPRVLMLPKPKRVPRPSSEPAIEDEYQVVEELGLFEEDIAPQEPAVEHEEEHDGSFKPVNEVEILHGILALSDSDSTSDDSDDDSIEAERDTNIALVQSVPETHRIRRPAKFGNARLFIHKLWRTLHRENTNDVMRLACGRLKHSGFVQTSIEGEFPKCNTCFGA